MARYLNNHILDSGHGMQSLGVMRFGDKNREERRTIYAHCK